MADVETDPRDAGLLATLQRDVFEFFRREADPDTGLVPDSTKAGSACSIASVGLGLAAWCVAAHAGLAGRDEASAAVLRVLRTLDALPQTAGSDAGGHRGFFYHFLDPKTGRRTGGSELSSIDTALLVAGALVAAEFFDAPAGDEAEVRRLAAARYEAVEWDWMMDGGPTPRMGWTPEGGFMAPRWRGYNEGLLLMVLALGSPTHPLPPESYAAFCESYDWVEQYGHAFLRAGPLFIHQLPQCFLDLRGVRDGFMRGKGSDYFLNSRAATRVQRAYAVDNPGGFAGYGPDEWGLTASNGPGPCERTVGGRPLRFYDYTARGVSAPPPGKRDPDDGTLAPWAVAASLPFAPDVVLPALRHLGELGIGATARYGYESTFNRTFADPASPTGFWMSADVFGLNQGPIVLMVENHRSGLVWALTRRSAPVRDGLRRAGFTGGWLG